MPPSIILVSLVKIGLTFSLVISASPLTFFRMSRVSFNRFFFCSFRKIEARVTSTTLETCVAHVVPDTKCDFEQGHDPPLIRAVDSTALLYKR